MPFSSPDEQVAFANKAIRALDAAAPPETALVLFVAPQGVKGLTTYISNSNREDIKRILRETLEKWEAEDAQG